MFGKNAIYKKIINLLNIDKPLVIFDIETTGLSISTDKIIEIAYVKIWPNGRIKQDSILFNPEMKITPEATSVHGIKSKDVIDKPYFRDRSQEIWDVFYDSYYSGFNIANFDLPLLRREFIRVGMDFDYDIKRVIDSRKLYHYMVPRTLSTAYEYYCKKQFKHEYNAVLDTEIAAEILMRQLEKYKETRDIKFINVIHQAGDRGIYVDNARKFYWHNGEAYFAFSKHKDKPLKQIVEEDANFLKWILESEFSNETKNIVKLALKGKIVAKEKK